MENVIHFDHVSPKNVTVFNPHNRELMKFVGGLKGGRIELDNDCKAMVVETYPDGSIKAIAYDPTLFPNDL